jgi:hypothetical protein
MSCNKDPHRSNDRSCSCRPSSSAITSEIARTRSEWPRVLRSWSFKISTSDNTCSAAICGSVASFPARNAARTDSAFPEFPTRRAIFKRDGAASGNCRFIWHKLDSGTNLDAVRETTVATTEATMNIATIQPIFAIHDQVLVPTRLPRTTVTKNEITIGRAATLHRIARPNHGRDCHVFRSS